MHQLGERPLDDRRWKRLNRFANMAFAKRRWDEAERLYAVALEEVGWLFDVARTGAVMRCDTAPMLVVATTNAAENWLMLDKMQEAGDAVAAMARRLAQTAEDETAPPAFRRACVVHLKGAVRGLTSILPRAGWSGDAVIGEVMHARSVALRVMAGG